MCKLANLLMLLATLAPAAPVTAMAQAPATTELDEVRVMGQKLWQLREEIVRAEDRFHGLYNQVNTVNDFDIQCQMGGTYIRNRNCQARFFIDAQTEQVQQMLQGRVAPAPILVQMQRQDDYRKAVTAALEASPELQRMAKEIMQLKERYEMVRRERFKDQWMSW